MASWILTSRARATTELATARGRGLIAARESWRRLVVLLGKVAPDPPRLVLPKPAHSLAVEAGSNVPPGPQRVVVQDMALQLKARQGLGIIRPRPAGKSSPARAIVRGSSAVPRKIRLVD